MKKTREIDSGNLRLHSPLIFLATVTLPLGILQKLKFCYNQKKEETKPQHRHICMICKPEKQLFTVLSCIENFFSIKTLAESLGIYPLQKLITELLLVQLYLN